MLKDNIEEAITLQQHILRDEETLRELETLTNVLVGCLKGGNKVLIAGNGGSAADAQHFAAELMGRFNMERKALPAIALTTDTSFLTSWSNDNNFETVFARQIEGLGKPGDVFIGISTSGNSKNIIEGVNKAREIGLKTACLLGRGGLLKGRADLSLLVPSDNTARIQEVHIMLIHAICEEVEKRSSE